ncbi:hypothetical protein DFJ58DRAFT_841965 [Suillus subalutaceus]|uniref:uncharacterized protein n=1 Tax=Suillus subalutaceus TaxID=48586 RepID=UPI001B87E9E4|nr:uncharacterized protein DFJ58DRAFT_841965 [Suillus subalutaceus]KAG1852102.1 hypothetical protein DFJ58DRAFT_841965 [Suillus subalutaceus]
MRQVHLAVLLGFAAFATALPSPSIATHDYNHYNPHSAKDAKVLILGGGVAGIIAAMTKHKLSRDSTQETHTSNEATARGSSHRPCNRAGVKSNVKYSAKKLRILRSKDSHSPAPPNIKDQAASSGVELEADIQSALWDAQEAARRMYPLPGPAITVASVDQDAQADLDAADGFQDTYLKPLRIFDTVIGEIANLKWITMKWYSNFSRKYVKFTVL